MVNIARNAVNEVFLDDHGVIHGIYHGPQNGRIMQRTFNRIMKIMDTLIKQDMPVRLLIDIRDMGAYDMQGKMVEMHARTILPFWKMAFVTDKTHPQPEQISRKLTLMSGRRKEIRYFEREDDAIGWLSYMVKSM
jgi:hypothetical protein